MFLLPLPGDTFSERFAYSAARVRQNTFGGKPVALRERLERVKQHGPSCSVGTFLATLNPDQVAEFDDLCAAGELSSVLSKAIKAEYGVDIAGGTIARHRRRDCQCP